MEPLTPAGAGSSIPERFRAVAQEGPARLAVRGRLASWSYEELDAISSRVAHALLSREPDAGRPILLFLETEAPLAAAMLGVLKAGLFYAPVDPAFGPERAGRLAALAGSALVLTRRGLRGIAESLAPSVVEIDGLLAGGPEMSAAPVILADSPAYVLFTSGSTGEPKGIVQSHRGVLANMARLAAGLRLTPDDRITLLTSASYGASVSDLYGALLHGAAVLPFDPRAVSPDAWRDWAAAEGITIWHSVPGLFRSFARTVEDTGQLPALRLFKLGGEAVFAHDLDLFKRRFREGAVFHVGLGMTEINIICQWFADHGTVCPTPVTPIGRPVGDLGVVLLGVDGEPVEDEGELGVAAAALPAYWRRPDLTARAFRPVAGKPDERLFLTGDLVRRLPGGDLLHLGRRDREIKVRGLRVDASAVEAALRGLPGVRDAAVDLRTVNRGERALVGWLVPDGQEAVSNLSDLRARLAATLPPEAVPAHLVAVAGLPTLGPGKIDRGGLPDPPTGRRELSAPFVAPETVEEERVAAVFAEVLGIESVGVLDDFFAAGGSSLLTLDALLGLGKILGRPVDAAIFLSEPTPRGIARRLAESRGLLATLAEGTEGDQTPPVFFIPGHGGGEGPDLLQLARLARRARFGGPSFALRFPESVPPRPEALLDLWTGAVLAKQPAGPWRLVAACAGGPIGFALARRLSSRGKVRLVLHDALFPTRDRRLRRFLRRLREPWGDDLVVRLRHHLRVLARRGLASALAYIGGRARSAARGLQRRADPTVQLLVRNQDAYLRLSFSCRPEPWDGEVMLIVTPGRREQGLPGLWRTVSPRLAIRETGEDAEHESAVLLQELFAAQRYE